MRMEPTETSETSAINVTWPPGTYQKDNKLHNISTLLGYKILRLVNRTDLFQISHLVYGGRETETRLYRSLEGQRQFVAGQVS